MRRTQGGGAGQQHVGDADHLLLSSNTATTSSTASVVHETPDLFWLIQMLLSTLQHEYQQCCRAQQSRAGG
jgi:hypothetical protein